MHDFRGLMRFATTPEIIGHIRASGVSLATEHRALFLLKTLHKVISDVGKPTEMPATISSSARLSLDAIEGRRAVSFYLHPQ